MGGLEALAQHEVASPLIPETRWTESRVLRLHTGFPRLWSVLDLTCVARHNGTLLDEPRAGDAVVRDAVGLAEATVGVARADYVLTCCDVRRVWLSSCAESATLVLNQVLFVLSKICLAPAVADVFELPAFQIWTALERKPAG